LRVKLSEIVGKLGFFRFFSYFREQILVFGVNNEGRCVYMENLGKRGKNKTVKNVVKMVGNE
jgi:hypothetical protein